MKKIYLLFLLLSLFTGGITSCSDDDETPPPVSTPTPPVVSIENTNEKTTCLPGETIELKAKLSSPLSTTFSWQLDKKEVSIDSIYRFNSAKLGVFEVILTATNLDGVDSDTLSIEVSDGKFRFANIKNWTGEGENLSALTIQWVMGKSLLEPADDEIFFLAWGYRWKNTAASTGVDMLKAVAKSDPRLYVILAEQWGAITVKGFGYDGNNDGKIEIKNATLHLTEADFVDGVYMQVEGVDVDEIKPVSTDDYWIGGWNKAYASYWLGGNGDVISETDDFEYASFVASERELENNSWDAWTFSPIDPQSMGNMFPISRLIQAAEANK